MEILKCPSCRNSIFNSNSNSVSDKLLILQQLSGIFIVLWKLIKLNSSSHLCYFFLAAAGIPQPSAGYPLAPYVINPQEPYTLIAAGSYF